MIPDPWNVVLSVLFAATGLICLIDLVRRRRADTSRGSLGTADIVDITHLAMGVAMILMIWADVIDVVTWVQVALFAVFAVALVPAFRPAGRHGRLDLAGHLVLDLAMIWMLLAMPVLMGGTDPDAGGHHHAAAGAAAQTLAAPPMWAVVVDAVVVALVLVAAFWWLGRLVAVRRHRLHTACHVAMAGGMAAMLLLMAG